MATTVPFSIPGTGDVTLTTSQDLGLSIGGGAAVYICCDNPSLFSPPFPTRITVQPGSNSTLRPTGTGQATIWTDCGTCPPATEVPGRVIHVNATMPVEAGHHPEHKK
jgi:hypothetical protein